MKKVLIIEDRPEALELLSFWIQCRMHAEILTAADVADSLHLLGLHKFDLVVCDYLLTDGTGDDILNFMKQSSIAAPVIIFTSRMELKLLSDYPVLDIVTKKDYEKLFQSLAKL